MSIKNDILRTQYQFTKLFTLGIRRRAFSIKETKDGFISENNSRNTYITLLFTLFLSGLIFSGMIEVFFRGVLITVDFIIVLFILHVFLGIIGLRHFLWLMNGKHIIRINECELILEKKGTFLTKPRVYKLELIKKLSPTVGEDQMSLYDKIQDRIRLNHKLLFSHTYGQLTFEYEGRTVKLFSDLTQTEKVHLVERIEEKIKNCHQHALAASSPRPGDNSC